MLYGGNGMGEWAVGNELRLLVRVFPVKRRRIPTQTVAAKGDLAVCLLALFELKKCLHRQDASLVRIGMNVRTPIAV